MKDLTLGKLVWQERPAEFIFVAKKDKRMFNFADISKIKAEMRKARKDKEEQDASGL